MGEYNHSTYNPWPGTIHWTLHPVWFYWFYWDSKKVRGMLVQFITLFWDSLCNIFCWSSLLVSELWQLAKKGHLNVASEPLVWGGGILLTLICHKIENFRHLWLQLADGDMWPVVMFTPLNYCLNLSAANIGAKNTIWNINRGYPSLPVYRIKGFQDKKFPLSVTDLGHIHLA